MKSELKSPKIKLNYITITIIISLLISFLLIDRTLFFEETKTVLPLYVVGFISLIFFLAYLYKYGIPKNNMKYLFITFLIYFMYISMYSFRTSDINGLKHSFIIFAFIAILFLISYSILNRSHVLLIVALFSPITIILFLMWIPTNEFFKYTSVFDNSNALGIIVFLNLFLHLLVFFLYSNRISKVLLFSFILMDLILLYVSTSRSVWIAMIAGVFFYVFYKAITFNKLIYRLTFIFIMIGIFLFSYAYPKLYVMKLGWEIDAFILKLTGKSLFTGRQELWLYLIKLITEKPIFGHGVSKSLRDYLALDLSSHNTYLSMLLKTGMIGFILYLVILFLIWELLYPRSNDLSNKNKISALFPAFFVSILVFQVFELNLFQGPYSINAIEWLILAMGISMNNKKVIKPKYKIPMINKERGPKRGEK